MINEMMVMDKKKGLVPELRFGEFDTKWIELTLGDLLTFKNGLNSEKEKYGSGIKFINVLDIINNNFITYNNIIGSVEVSEKEFEKNEVVYGDILFQRSSETREEVGQANVYLDRDRSSVFGGFVIRGRKVQDYDPLFMNFLLKTSSARKEITTKSGGSTRYNVGQETLKEVKITSTSLPEQKKIATFLSSIDQKIQQLSRKKALLEQYKKGLMQQLFSGELRFKEENGEEFPDWEEKRLGDICIKVGSGSTPSGGIQVYQNHGVPFIRSQNVVDNKLKLDNIHISEAINLKMKGSIVKPNDILLNITGASIGRSCVVPEFFERGNVNQHVCIVRLKEKYDPRYLQPFFASYGGQKLVYQGQTGSGREGLNFQSIRFFKINCPPFLEQQKIANALSSIDTKIETIANKITKTQIFKKGLLQQMFV